MKRSRWVGALSVAVRSVFHSTVVCLCCMYVCVYVLCCIQLCRSGWKLSHRLSTSYWRRLYLTVKLSPVTRWLYAVSIKAHRLSLVSQLT